MSEFIECPHCDTENELIYGEYEKLGAEHEKECPSCGETVYFTTEIKFNFTTFKFKHEELSNEQYEEIFRDELIESAYEEKRLKK
mgnify:CR=1 FL=1